MGYFYAAAWFLVAIILIVRFRSESPLVYVLAAYFVFLGMWWLVNQLIPTDLMSGYYVWVLRGVSAFALLFCGIGSYLEKRRRTTASSADTEETEENSL